ncbi:MAG: hypothetical protein P8J75_02780 [Actinomycetota bacterium]|nr:hypothetical protein [Actinomycetota bacterium]
MSGAPVPFISDGAWELEESDLEADDKKSSIKAASLENGLLAF